MFSNFTRRNFNSHPNLYKVEAITWKKKNENHQYFDICDDPNEQILYALTKESDKKSLKPATFTTLQGSFIKISSNKKEVINQNYKKISASF